MSRYRFPMKPNRGSAAQLCTMFHRFGLCRAESFYPFVSQMKVHWLFSLL